MAVTAASIIAKIRSQLIDDGAATGYRWTDPELLRYLSDGQRAIVIALPRANAKPIAFALVAGSTQTLPADTYQFLAVYTRNGFVPQVISRQMFDVQRPGWENTVQTTQVQALMPPEFNRREFYVYPPNNGSGVLSLVYSAEPVELTSTGQNIEVWDILQTALFDYAMYRAHSKDSDFAAGAGLAANYLASFNSTIAAAAA